MMNIGFKVESSLSERQIISKCYEKPGSHVFLWYCFGYIVKRHILEDANMSFVIFSVTGIGVSRAQRGVSQVVALIALLAMSLVAVTLVRTVDANTRLSGNLAFRQGAILVADQVAEQARSWLLAHHASSATALDNDRSAEGYYASAPKDGEECQGRDYTGVCTNADVQEIRWQNQDGSVHVGTVTPFCTAIEATGDRACYVIERLCENTGAFDAKRCQGRSAPSKAEKPSECAEGRDCGDVPGFKWTGAVSSDAAFYRITVRIAGPRDNAAYTQTFVLL
jgi:Tfp pilus assembly protein PilX